MTALDAPGRFGWLDLAALDAPGRPGWLDLATQVALRRLGWLDLAALVAPGRPDWLDLAALCAPGRLGWLDLAACLPRCCLLDALACSIWLLWSLLVTLAGYRKPKIDAACLRLLRCCLLRALWYVSFMPQI